MRLGGGGGGGGQVQQLVIVVNGVESGETLERWCFQVEQAKDKENGGLVEQQVLHSERFASPLGFVP